MRAGISGASYTPGGSWRIPYNPFFTLRVACNRQERLSGRVIGPDQWLDADTALRLFTVAGAKLSFDEGWRRQPKPGFAADLAVPSKDPTAIPPSKRRELRCRMTVVGGRFLREAG